MEDGIELVNLPFAMTRLSRLYYIFDKDYTHRTEDLTVPMTTETPFFYFLFLCPKC